MIAFVPAEHTPRNTLIRAVRSGRNGDAAAAASARALAAMFDVRPRLATLLEDRL